ncbi:MAG: LysR family transcriptional regulator [Rhodobacteraceae bacterium]|nr:LysR family transcriptional regulator [Paracoccaceae bacterium]
MAGRLFELTHLRSFVAVAEELNFRRAASRLNMTQPPLSRHISLLEHAVGARLLDRTNRSVRLTAAGRRFLPDAIDILTRAESAALLARQAARGESGSIVLGFVPSAAVEVIPRVVSRLRRDMPGVNVTLREMMTFEQIEGLMAGSIEIGLMRLPHRDTALPLRKVWSEPFVLAVPRSHPLASKPEIVAADLNNQPFVGYSIERGGFLFEIVHGFLTARGVNPDTLYAVAQSHTIMALINEGIGMGLVPRSNRMICMPDTVIRQVDLPPDLRSDLYLALGPKEPDAIVAEVASLIERELAVDREVDRIPREETQTRPAGT